MRGQLHASPHLTEPRQAFVEQMRAGQFAMVADR
jgi:hypothetical protein